LKGAPSDVGKPAVAEYRHEHLRRHFRSRLPVGIAELVPGVIDEHPLYRFIPDMHPKSKLLFVGYFGLVLDIYTRSMNVILKSLQKH
jgi:hypothetical protein